MKINVKHTCEDFTSFRAEKVKSLFNAESGHTWEHTAELPIEGDDWQIGLIVGPSGSGKTSIGKQIWDNGIINLSEGWNENLPIVEDIAPHKSMNEVTAALSAVGLGDVPAWLRPFKVLSNGEQFRAGLARLICEDYDKVIVDEFTSVVDRQIAKIGASAFAKSFRKNGKKQIILLSCHYDIVEWLQPDWVYDTREGVCRKKSQAVPPIQLDIWKADGSFWKFFKEHYYLDLPHPPCAEYFVGTVDGELVCHLAVTPLFTAKAYRATRLVVMPEWQGAGVGTQFLNFVMQYHLEGNGRKGYKYHTFFHTSHPQLCGYLRNSKLWRQTSAKLHGDNKLRSMKSMQRTCKPIGGGKKMKAGYGGHFRAVQGFKYLGVGTTDSEKSIQNERKI